MSKGVSQNRILVARVALPTVFRRRQHTSLAYLFTDQFTLTVGDMNLLSTQRYRYFGSANKPQDRWINDRQAGIAMVHS
jgi:hypothetical protein